MTIRLLTIADAEALYALRLEALATDPDAFLVRGALTHVGASDNRRLAG